MARELYSALESYLFSPPNCCEKAAIVLVTSISEERMWNDLRDNGRSSSLASKRDLYTIIALVEE
jgi:hypothetical protein